MNDNQTPQTPRLTTDADQGIPGVAKTPEEYMAFLDKLVEEMKRIGYTPQLKWLTATKI